MLNNISKFLYCLTLVSFSLKVPFLGITGPYLFSLIGILRPKGITRDFLVFWSLLILYFIFIFAVNILTADLLEFWKSLINVVLFGSAFALASYILKTNQVGHTVFRYISFGILIFAIVQIGALLLFEDDSYFFLLDPLSISTSDDVGRFQAANLLWYIRPSSIYHEPSFFGLVSLVLLHLYKVTTGKLSFINIFSIILSMSSTAMFFTLLYIFWYRKMFWKILGMIMVLVLIINFYKYTRIEEIFMPGTSGHERLIKPILDLVVNLNRNHLAIPLGNLFPQTNNSLQILFAYFGIFSGLLIVFVSRIYKVMPVVLCILFTNGAFLTPDGAILLATTLYGRPKL